MLLIAGGIGITPLRALFESLPAGPGDLTLLYRASRDADVVFGDELAAHRPAARRPAARASPAAAAELGYDPLSAAALTANLPDLADHDVYVCGPEPMTAAVTSALRAAKVPRRQIHHESFEF